MSERQFASSAAAKLQTKTSTCPCVADLIDYALGKSGGDERRRIDDHLNQESCSVCRGGGEKAACFRAEPMMMMNGSLTPDSAATSALPSASDPTPIPPS